MWPGWKSWMELLGMAGSEMDLLFQHQERLLLKAIIDCFIF
jgi:hypothetical protein